MRKATGSSYRIMILTIGVLSIAAVAAAADPMIGTWSLNISKSAFSPAAAARLGPPPKQQIETYREIEGNQIEFSATQTQGDGSSASFKYVWPAPEGGAVKVEQFPDGEPPTYVEVRLAPGEWLMIAMQDGKQVARRHKLISRDGKTRTDTVTMFSRRSGESFEYVEVYDRQ